MYFFDLEDYRTSTSAGYDADRKGGGGGHGIVSCSRPYQHAGDYGDGLTTAKETADAFSFYVHRWFTASTINIGNSTNTLARDIYYNEFIPNFVEYQINFRKYANQSYYTRKHWSAVYVDDINNGQGPNPSTFIPYEEAWTNLVTDGSSVTYGSVSSVPYSGATNYLIISGSPITDTLTWVPITIIHPQFNDWNDSYYNNHNNSLRKVMGSLKALMKAIDNDDFEDFTP